MFKVDWATWMPQKNDGKGNGEYDYNGNGSAKVAGSGIRKIVLVVQGWDTPPATNDYSTHFSIDVTSNGKAWQHIDMDKPGYRLGKEKDYTGFTYDGNKHAGKTIQVNILKFDHKVFYEDGWWTDDKYKRLAWFLSKICTQNGVPKQFPKKFSANRQSNSESDRLLWDYYYNQKGIFGMMHSPWDEGLWSPGPLDLARLGPYLLDTNITNTSQADPSKTSEQQIEEAIAEAKATEDMEKNAETVTDELVDLIDETPMEGKVFRFNPPLHRDMIPQRVEFSSNDPGGFLQSKYLDERGLAEGTTSVEDLMPLRLGRIIQHEMAAGMAATNTERYGFRFLYNPTSITISSSRNDSVVLDPRSSINAVISGINQNFQTIRMTLFLVRMPDVLSPIHGKDDYMPSISDEDMEGVRKYGTHWDLEILYRVCNGIFTLGDRGRTADIGVIVPSNTRLLLGHGRNFFGFVESINYTDKVFSSDMVPVQTEVELVFRRHVDMAPGSLTSFYANLGEVGAGTGGGGSTSETGDTDPAGTGATSGEGLDPMALLHKNGLNAGWTYGNKDQVSMAVMGGKHRAWDIEAKYEGLLAGVEGTVAALNDGVTREGDRRSGSPSNWIRIHTNYGGGAATVYYQHLSPNLGCTVGQRVTPTTYLGKTGNSGNSSGPHLHLATMRGHTNGNYLYLNDIPATEAGSCIYPPSTVFPK
jgi:Peptidase family M23